MFSRRYIERGLILLFACLRDFHSQMEIEISILHSNGQIVTKKSRSLTLNLDNQNGHVGGSRNFGTLTVHAEETVASRSVVEIVFRCTNLENKDLFSKSVCIYLMTKKLVF